MEMKIFNQMIIKKVSFAPGANGKSSFFTINNRTIKVIEFITNVLWFVNFTDYSIKYLSLHKSSFDEISKLWSR